MTRPDTRPYLLMLSGSFSFALMAQFAYVLTRQCDWQLVAIARAGLVAAFAAIIAAAAGARLVFWPWRLWVRSVAGSCSMVFTFYAFSRLPAADVLTLTNTFPIWVALLSWPLTGRPPSLKMVAAILVGVVGVVLVEQPHLESGNRGVYSALVAALLTAVAMLGLHSLKGIDPRAIVVHFSAVATAVCVAAYFTAPYVFGPLEHDPAGVAEPEILLKLTGMAVTATVGQLFLTLAFGSGAPAQVSVVGLSQIVMALGFDAWLWDRPVDAVTLAGTALVIAPTAWLLTRPAARP
ncbi:MAG TPA: DMT family transporter [Urbifossiella sp.]|jgi:drug/metabolite transporter (DMT)-like permease|nr:DMT family transporter [Urbifossiella sp.]